MGSFSSGSQKRSFAFDRLPSLRVETLLGEIAGVPVRCDPEVPVTTRHVNNRDVSIDDIRFVKQLAFDKIRDKRAVC